MAADGRDHVVEQAQYFGRRQFQPGVGANRGPQLSHHRGRGDATTHHVAEDEAGPPALEIDDVVPVAAGLGPRDAGPVIGGDLDAVGCEGERRQQAALQLLGNLVFPGGGFARRRGARLSQLRLPLLGDVLDAAAQGRRRTVLAPVQNAVCPQESLGTVGPDDANLGGQRPSVPARGVEGRSQGVTVVLVNGAHRHLQAALAAQRFLGQTEDPQVLRGRLHAAADEVDLPAADMRQRLGLVEQLAAAGQFLGHPAHPVEFEVGPHPREQLASRERLDQVVVGTRLEPGDRCVIA